VITANAQVAMARTGDQTHPVFALVRADLLTDLEAFLASGRRRIDTWTGRLHTIDVPFADEVAFANINTPQELQQHATRRSP
jgi:molybdopterin-guanine dinucleotide biosynthesis protein A